MSKQLNDDIERAYVLGCEWAGDGNHSASAEAMACDLDLFTACIDIDAPLMRELGHDLVDDLPDVRTIDDLVRYAYMRRCEEAWNHGAAATQRAGTHGRTALEWAIENQEGMKVNDGDTVLDLASAWVQHCRTEGTDWEQEITNG